MIGNNSCGAHSAAYGKTVDNLDSMDVLLYDGTQNARSAPPSEADNQIVCRRAARAPPSIPSSATCAIATRPRCATDSRLLPRRVSGYNLSKTELNQ